MKNFRDAGFTLMELMATLAVAAVVLAIAVPNMSEYAKNRRLTATANDLLATLHAARAEALKRQLPVTTCFTTTPDAATPTCDGNGTQGWFTWVDANGSGIVEVGEQIVARHEPLPTTLSLVTKPAATSNTVSYAPSGFARTAVANPLSGLVLCDDRKNTALSGDISAARGLVVDVTGRSWVTKSHSTIQTHGSLLAGASSGTCV